MLPRRLSRAGIATGLVLLLVVIAATVLSYLDVKNHPTKGDNPGGGLVVEPRVRSAIQTACQQLQADLAAIPPARTGRQRRWRIRAQDAAVTHMVSTVRAAEGPDDPLRNWLWSWETLVRARQRQAATVARRLHVPAPFGRPITQDIAVIADGNSLPSCRVPDALLTLS
jgi:hypothetical protein